MHTPAPETEHPIRTPRDDIRAAGGFRTATADSPCSLGMGRCALVHVREHPTRGIERWDHFAQEWGRYASLIDRGDVERLYAGMAVEWVRGGV